MFKLQICCDEVAEFYKARELHEQDRGPLHQRRKKDLSGKCSENRGQLLEDQGVQGEYKEVPSTWLTAHLHQIGCKEVLIRHIQVIHGNRSVMLVRLFQMVVLFFGILSNMGILNCRGTGPIHGHQLS
ncbi:hypothetical protein J3A83DRAFT_4193443 [Scleroderma citrinum]